jgi:protein-S-isoprenylcysteine O-methyltransferase Ste14
MSIMVMGISFILECEKARLLGYIFLTERWYIVPEENQLTAAFGEQYKSYQMCTRRWL